MVSVSGFAGLIEVTITPFLDAPVAVPLLLFIGIASLVQPALETFFILLQHQELPEYHISFVIAFGPQPFTQHWPYPGQLCHTLVSHGLSNEVRVHLGVCNKLTPINNRLQSTVHPHLSEPRLSESSLI